MITAPVDGLAFGDEIRRISREVAAVHADEVDRDARFPIEAIDALKEVGALSAYVPASLGGAGLSLREISGACRDLARGCSATAMVFAMHQLQIGNLARHAEPDSWIEDYLRGTAASQPLIASITSEIGTGGDMARSIAAVTPSAAGRLSLHKQAPTVSYGAHCDDFLTSLRRSPDAQESDQVMVLHPRAEATIAPSGDWDTLGMRGTCSPGFTIDAEFDERQILGPPFSKMMAETIVPLSHLLWAHAWLGIATEAFERGRAFVRAAALRAPDQTVGAARPLSNVLVDLQLLRSEVESALGDFERWDAEGRLGTISSVVRFNGLKLAASERSPAICGAVMEAIGIMAYKNDSPFSVGRQLRDAMSGRLMIANERLHATNAGLLAITKGI
jgi:acyl-CoA dehydrogenase